MDNIVLTYNNINITLFAAQRNNHCRIPCCPLELLAWAILLPHSAFIYVGVSGSWPRYLDIIRLSHMKY